MPNIPMRQEALDLLALRLKLGRHLIKKRAFLSTGKDDDKKKILPGAQQLAELGVEIFATRGTSTYLTMHSVPNTLVHKVAEDAEPNVASMLESGLFDLVVNVLTGDDGYDEKSDARTIRGHAIERGVPLITDPDVAVETIAKMVRDMERQKARKNGHTSMREYFATLVHERGGYVDNHGHYDKAYLITPETLALGEIDMQEKWRLYRRLKESYTPEDLVERISRCVEFRLSQGVTLMRTMVDADTIVKMKCIEAALEVKRRYAGKVTLEIGIQPLEGVIDPDARKWVTKACELADFIGGLPSRDNPRLESHLDVILGMGKEMGKRVDVHVDQKGVPWENETRLLALKTVEHGMEGQVSAVHSIISRKPLYEQREIAKMTTGAGITVIVCPRADVSMKQEDMQGQLSNCIPPVPLYREEGTRVVYGSDNSEDPFMPFNEGDPWIETCVLMEGVRTYTATQIADIMCDRSLFSIQSQQQMLAVA